MVKMTLRRRITFATVCVVHTVQLNGGCLKKSQIDILGVFEDEDNAEKQRAAAEAEIKARNGANEFFDARCSYVRIRALLLNNASFRLS